MPEILLNNDDLTIIGPPEQIELFVDIGSQGDRGSRIFTGNGAPGAEDVVFGSISVKPGDFYLDVQTSSGTYTYLYEYAESNVPGVYIWDARLKVNPALYSEQHTITFTSGTGTINIPITDIAGSVTGLTANNLNVQYSFVDSSGRPISSSITKTVASNTLTVTINAVKYESSAWAALTGDVTVQFFVSVM